MAAYRRWVMPEQFGRATVAIGRLLIKKTMLTHARLPSDRSGNSRKPGQVSDHRAGLPPGGRGR
jgi:hypothetical protein